MVVFFVSEPGLPRVALAGVQVALTHFTRDDARHDEAGAKVPCQQDQDSSPQRASVRRQRVPRGAQSLFPESDVPPFGMFELLVDVATGRGTVHAGKRPVKVHAVPLRPQVSQDSAEFTVHDQVPEAGSPPVAHSAARALRRPFIAARQAR